ncbi:hypothetical protein F4810DRAFT_267933 [Camillea tinctor]|nr:hypothetical protein F4810DRAFT_267933 [Camillea tinctor]
MRTSGNKRLTAAERKRERDKLNQRNKRQRERERIATLEETICRLEQELQLATGSAHVGSVDLQTNNNNKILTASCLSDTLLTAHNLVITNSSNSSSRPSSSSISSSPEPIMMTLSMDSVTKLINTQEWKRLPLLSFSPLPAPLFLLQTERVGSVIEQLRSTPNVAELLPGTPSALDLLFGGSGNELADIIVSALAPYPILPPEKFAIAWLIYIYFRWYVAPSEESFAAIPPHMRPTTCQFFITHPVHIVAIIWPELRDQLILHWSKYNLESVFGLLSCTIRIRESFNGSFIKRENGGEPQVDEAFYQRFMHRDGWGILERFKAEYPDLMEGIDDKIMIREEHLLPA